MPASIVISGLHFAWPDGAVLFDDLNAAVGAGRSGLVGVNGSGKSTLLRLITGDLVPGRGSVRHTGRLAYLPQDITLDGARRVDEVLGIADIRAALRAIDRGQVTEATLTAVGDRWDAEEQALATIERLGLAAIGLDRTVREISGGEAVLLALAARLLRRPDVLLLDEPTNNLDLRARRRLFDILHRPEGRGFPRSPVGFPASSGRAFTACAGRVLPSLPRRFTSPQALRRGCCGPR